MERGHLMAGRPLRARLCDRPGISPESNSGQTLQKSFGWDYKQRPPVCIRMPKDHLRTVKMMMMMMMIVIHSFYIALFSALKQTHCAHWHVILNEWLYPYIARIINIPGSGVLVALCGCCIAGFMWNAAVSAQVLCTPFSHAPGYSVISLKAT